MHLPRVLPLVLPLLAAAAPAPATELQSFLARHNLPADTAQGLTGAAAACEIGSQLLGGNSTVDKGDSGYETLRTRNWAATAWLTPSCIATPSTSAEVASLLHLFSLTSTKFALRSGGHQPAPGFASVDSGVLIDLQKLASIDPHPSTSTVTIGPGARWGAVYAALTPLNLTTVGGRVGDVGVGGLLVGGGLSYLSARYGLPCDNIVSTTVALTSGAVVTASTTSHSDLFWALKGGSSNLGIVTSYTLRTYPQSQIWGGLILYPLSAAPALLKAYDWYLHTGMADARANLMIQIAPLNDTVFLNIFYDGPNPRPAAFKPFFEIANVSDQTAVQSFSDMLAVAPSQSLGLTRWAWGTTTLAATAAASGAAWQDLLTLGTKAKTLFGDIPGRTVVLGFQPISAKTVDIGRAAGNGGGNALGLTREDQTWFVVNGGWLDAADDAAAYNATNAILEGAKTVAKQRGVGREFVFMNDAGGEQDVIGGYGRESLGRMRKVAARYDMRGVMQRLQNDGFKLGV
ncbi:putative FAD-binding oxidoreductase [Geopyxis carbonaria]|nr:putative FAD-binding oxidoreductase [Geopyxis carbonaria]